MIRLNENYRYAVQEETAIEDFEDGSLLFLCKQRKIIEMNQTARRVFALMNGKRDLKRIIEIISHNFKINEKIIRKDIHKLVKELSAQGAIKPLVRMKRKGRQKMGKTSNMMVNPDVSLREEKGEGAILFNAKTDSLLIINPIGMAIWQFLKFHPRSKSDIVAHLMEICDDVPQDQVENDVDTFVDDLHVKGFIGEVVGEKRK